MRRKTPPIRRDPTCRCNPRLTPRECEVLCLVAHGHSNRCIAAQLQVSEKSVETYMHRILTALTVENRWRAVLKVCIRCLASEQG